MINRNFGTNSRVTFILGHSSAVLQIQDNTEVPKNMCCNFKGNVGFVNMWSYLMEAEEINLLISDCKLEFAGDVIQWSNFRSGTRGIKIRWPSNIFDTRGCFTEEQSVRSCDKYCSIENGPRCREEFLENILWERTPADTLVKLPCMNKSSEDHINETQQKYLFRRCVKLSVSEGLWSPPVVDSCISRAQLFLKAQTKKLLKSLPSKESDIPSLMSLLNTSSAQNSILRKFWTSSPRNISTFGLNRKSDMVLYPSLSNSDRIIKASASAINNLLKPTIRKSWLDSNPPGYQMAFFLQTIHNWFTLIGDTIHFHLAKGELFQPELAHIDLELENLEIRIGMFRKSNLNEAFQYRSSKNRMRKTESCFVAYLNKKTTKIPDTFHPNDDAESDYQTYSFGIFWVLDTLNKNPEDLFHQRLNSGLFFFMAHQGSREHNELIITFPFIVTSNISQSKCVRVENNVRSSVWDFSYAACTATIENLSHITCVCTGQGFFGVLSNMFDPNFVPPEKELNHVTYPTYIGCFASIILCGTTLLCLRLRSSSNSPSIHSHFAISIITGHFLFMFGIEEVGKDVLCLAVAILQHFFTLSSFCWLMNEAFNLYIIITYSNHSRTEHFSEEGSMFKYYIIGWAFPALFVGSFCAANLDDYLSPKMCYISWTHSLFLFVPVAIVVIVTLLVLIFTVKEQLESSYSKNEKTNETISIYSKALWAQIVLMLTCWLFALASITMEGSIIKILQAFFNIMQGLFFYIFFYHLNEEARNQSVRRFCFLAKEEEGQENIPTTMSGEILWDGNRPRGMLMLKENEKLLQCIDFPKLQSEEYPDGDELVTTV